MSSLQEIKAKVDQIPAEILAEGSQEHIRQTKLGQIFTADWKMRLLLAGKLWKVTVGAANGSADVTPLSQGTTLDLDLPEVGIGIGAGYFLIPISIMVACQVDMDADGEYGAIVAAVDRTSTAPAGTSTAETPLNLLDGAGEFPGVAYSAYNTTPITDPANEELLDYVYAVGSDFIPASTAAAGSAALNNQLKMQYEPAVPSIVAGPCSLWVCWGGTAAVGGLASIIVAAVPTSWFPVS